MTSNEARELIQEIDACISRLHQASEEEMDDVVVATCSGLCVSLLVQKFLLMDIAARETPTKEIEGMCGILQRSIDEIRSLKKKESEVTDG